MDGASLLIGGTKLVHGVVLFGFALPIRRQSRGGWDCGPANLTCLGIFERFIRGKRLGVVGVVATNAAA